MAERTRATVVIPCYNEADRLREAEVARLVGSEGDAAGDDRLRALLVDDGSTDETPALLRRLHERHGERVQPLWMGRNVGKAEAVRAGLRHALEHGADVVGYLDADFATPPEEMRRLLDVLTESRARVAMGSRIQRLGADIRRSMVRHYLGRVFATAASLVLQLPVYDCQCAAKLFRVDDTLRHALATPFTSRWIFDVELIGRLLAGGPGAPPLTEADFLEVPLHAWHDVAGSKLGTGGMANAGLDLARLAGARWRRGAHGFHGEGS